MNAKFRQKMRRALNDLGVQSFTDHELARIFYTRGVRDALDAAASQHSVLSGHGADSDKIRFLAGRPHVEDIHKRR